MIYDYSMPRRRKLVISADVIQKMIRQYLLYERGIDLPDGAKINPYTREVEWDE